MFTTALMQNPIFQKSQTIIDFVSVRLETQSLLPEFKVISQGELGNCLYIISKGEWVITITDHMGNSHIVKNLEIGSVFGEIALL